MGAREEPDSLNIVCVCVACVGGPPSSTKLNLQLLRASDSQV